jgi:hypothetical protein
MADVPVELEPGSRFGVAIPGLGIVRALVRWTEGGQLGGSFQRALDTALVYRLAACEPFSCSLFGTHFTAA